MSTHCASSGCIHAIPGTGVFDVLGRSQHFFHHIGGRAGCGLPSALRAQQGGCLRSRAGNWRVRFLRRSLVVSVRSGC